jgi:hypothetical protein
MKDEEILKKAIERVRKNKDYDGNQLIKQGDYEIIVIPSAQVFPKRIIIDAGLKMSVKDLLFSHSFARAFWGDADFYSVHGEITANKVWEYHLQQMVLEEETIKYLEKFL